MASPMKPEKNAECLDCGFVWFNFLGETCPRCGSTDIAHTS